MFIRLFILMSLANLARLNAQDVDEMILNYYSLIQQEKYDESMEYNYLARGSEEDKAFILDLMSGDDETPGYGTMIQEIRIVKIG